MASHQRRAADADRRTRPSSRRAHASARVTDKISEHRRSSARTPRGWFVGFAHRVRAAACCCCYAMADAALQGRRHLGHQRPGRLGLRHHQLRLVDRHRPRRHADLGDPAAAAAGLAHLDQPLRRGDDALRGGLRGHLPDLPHRPAVARATGCCPYPEHDGPVAATSAARSSGTSSRSRPTRTVSVLFWYVGLIPDLATLRDRAQEQGLARSSTASLAMGWRGSARHWHRYETAYLLLAGAGDAARALGAHGRELRLRGRHRARLARHDLPALLRRRAPSTPASRWC